MCLYFSVNDGRCIVTMDLSDMNSDTTSKKEPTDPSELYTLRSSRLLG